MLRFSNKFFKNPVDVTATLKVVEGEMDANHPVSKIVAGLGGGFLAWMLWDQTMQTEKKEHQNQPSHQHGIK